MDFKLKVRDILDGLTIIHVEGEVDIGTVNQLLAEIDGIKQQTVVLDFNKVTFIDSTGIGLLVRKIMEFREEGRNLKLRSLPDIIYEILDEMGIFEALGDLEEGNAHENK
ncbi:STAS domain-containing protein [Effusibacillus pohliae]|uniref:STAS domain-containing protein n=1 Tax=Effusibacillus pohliae TaxID=232270 RepID=UPI00036B99D7|nr:STAS domain-containing protein [Effusibacillus pohliae]